VGLFLAEKGYRVTCADISPDMVAITKKHVKQSAHLIPVDREDVEDLRYPDLAFDSVICFRLFHHFPTPDIRQRAISALCRVSRQFVALSYFSPYAFTSLRRKLQSYWRGERSLKHTPPLSEIKSYFERAGFSLVKDYAQLPLWHTLHIAVFKRVVL
jgi:ubiquinone/menaquinone biosynthesis C-methylase UbiE